MYTYVHALIQIRQMKLIRINAIYTYIFFRLCTERTSKIFSRVSCGSSGVATHSELMGGGADDKRDKSLSI